MSDNLRFLCGGGSRSTVGSAERGVAGLGRTVGVQNGDGIWGWAQLAGDCGSLWPPLYCSMIFNSSTTVWLSAGRVGTLINLGF